MTDTDIVTRLAREAGARYMLGPGDEPTDGYLAFEDESHVGPPDYPALRRFAALIAGECARIIEAQDVDPAFKGRMAWAVRDRFKA